jgi:hypothetical protein
MNRYELIKNRLPKNTIITFGVVLSIIIGFAAYYINPLYILFSVFVIIGCLISLITPRLFLQITIIILVSTMAINIPGDYPIRLGLDVFISVILIFRAYLYIFFDAPENFHLPKISILFLIYILSMLFSTILSPDIISGVSYTVRQISFLAICILLPAYFSTEKDVFRLIILIIIAALPSLVSSIWGLITNWTSLEVIGYRVTYRAGITGVDGPWALSALLLVIAAVSFTMIVYYFRIKKIKKAIIFLGFVGVVILGLVSTFYRSGWIAFACMVIVASRRHFKVAFIFAVAVFTAYLLIPQIGLRINGIFDQNSTAFQRIEMWIWTIKTMFASPIHFLTGYGQSSYFSIKQAVGGAIWITATSPHDYYLSVLFSQGIPGLIIFMLLLYQIYLLSINISRSTHSALYQSVGEGLLLALVGMLVMSIGTTPFGTPSAAFYFWVFVAVSLIISRNT